MDGSCMRPQPWRLGTTYQIMEHMVAVSTVNAQTEHCARKRTYSYDSPEGIQERAALRGLVQHPLQCLCQLDSAHGLPQQAPDPHATGLCLVREVAVASAEDHGTPGRIIIASRASMERSQRFPPPCEPVSRLCIHSGKVGVDGGVRQQSPK